MNGIAHPSSFIPTDWQKAVRPLIFEAEKAKQLLPAQLDIIYKNDLFKILVPKKYGGKELPLPEAIRLEEGLAWLDGSMAWVVTLCAGAGWFGGFMNEDFAKDIFSDENVCLAGSGAPTGTTEITDDGYIINGRWLHASGQPHATIFTANCILTRNGEVLKDDNGNPLIAPFAFYAHEVEIEHTWQCMGMVATASNAYKTAGLQVPHNRRFDIKNDAPAIDTPLYHYPFLPLAEVTLAANLSGMALRFTDLALESFSIRNEREQAICMQIYNKCITKLQSARNDMYATIDASWQLCEAGKPISDDILHKVSATSRALATLARQTVDTLYPYCGLNAANPGTEINYVWRNLHTASQHKLLVYPME